MLLQRLADEPSLMPHQKMSPPAFRAYVKGLGFDVDAEDVLRASRALYRRLMTAPTQVGREALAPDASDLGRAHERQQQIMDEAVRITRAHYDTALALLDKIAG